MRLSEHFTFRFGFCPWRLSICIEDRKKSKRMNETFWALHVLFLFLFLSAFILWLVKQCFTFFQSPAKKMKVHDTFDIMNSFSHVWREYPILYDETVRNKKFSEDFKGTGLYICQCYQEIATALNMTADEVCKRRIKYVDGVTKGLGQLRKDIVNETTMNCPVPAMYKLIAFRWLWPFSKNYDAELMEGVVLDKYMVRALTRDLNKLTRANMDTSVVKEALRVVTEFLDKQALDKLDLKSTTEQCEETVFADASELTDIAEFEQCESSTSICAYLPPQEILHTSTLNVGMSFFSKVLVRSNLQSLAKEFGGGLMHCWLNFVNLEKLGSKPLRLCDRLKVRSDHTMGHLQLFVRTTNCLRTLSSVHWMTRVSIHLFNCTLMFYDITKCFTKVWVMLCH